MKFTVCPGEALESGPDTSGEEGLAKGAFIDKRYDCDGQANGLVVQATCLDIITITEHGGLAPGLYAH